MPGASTPAAPPRSSGLPSTLSMSSAATPPGRSNRTALPSALTMVDSRPTGVGPPSTISGMREPEIGFDGGSRRGAHPARGIGAGCGKRAAERGDQLGAETLGHPERDRAEAGGDQRVDRRARLERQDQRQRPRPECLGELLRQRIEQRDRLRHLKRRDMGDQRIEARPALGLEDARDGLAVGGVGGEPVDGLGRDRHDLARLDQGEGRRLRILLCNDCRHDWHPCLVARAYSGSGRAGK